MAITVLDEPNVFTPIYHPSYFRLDSDNKNELNFKYVFRIFINAVEVRNTKVSPEPVNGYGLYDARRHLLDFLSQEVFNILEANFQDAAKVEYVLHINEEYDDGLGGHIINVDEYIFNNKIGFNTRLDRNAFFGDLSKLQLSNFVPGEMLTNINPLTTVYQDDIFFLHFTFNPFFVNAPLFLKVAELDVSGNVLNITTISGSLAGEAQLVTMDLSLIAFNANTKFIEYYIEDSITAIPSQPVRLIVEPKPCTTYTPYKLIYLDSKGSFVSVNLDGVSKKEESTKVKTFRKYIDPLTETDTSRGIQRYFQDTTQKFSLNSFIFDDNSSLLFEELLRSDRVFMDLRNNSEFDNMDFAPVEILSKKFNELKSENSELINYTIEIRFAYEQINR